MNKKLLKLLDPSYGLYLHWKDEKEGKHGLAYHMLCATHWVCWFIIFLLLALYIHPDISWLGLLAVLIAALRSWRLDRR